MPKCIIPLADEYYTITRKITLQVVNRILREFELPKNVDIRFKGEGKQIYTWDSNTQLLKKDRELVDGANFGYHNTLEVEVKETVSDEGYGRNYLDAYQNIGPIWHHPGHGTSLSVLYNNRDFEIEFTYSTNTRQKSDFFQNQVLMFFGAMNNSFLMDLEYNITPRKGLWHLMKSIHEKQEAVAGYGVDYQTWLEQHTHNGCLFRLLRRDGKDGHLSFRESHAGVPIRLEFTEIPEKEKREGTAGHQFRFTLKFSFEKPHGLVAQYPVVIHNQMLEAKYLQAPIVESTYARGDMIVRDVITAASHRHMQGFYPSHGYSYTQAVGITVPLGDDWNRGEHYLPDNMRVLLTSVTPVQEESDQMRELTHLDAYVGTFFAMSNWMREYLRRHPESAHDESEALLYVTMFRNEDNMKHHVRLDADGGVSGAFKVGYRDVLRTVLCVPKYFKHHSQHFFRQLASMPRLVEDVYLQFGIVSDYKSMRQVVGDAKHQFMWEDGLSIERRLKTVLLTSYFKQFPYTKLGVWHQVVNHVLLGGDLHRRYGGLADFVKAMAYDSFTSDIENNYRVLLTLESEIYTHAAKLYPGMTEDVFYGIISVGKLAQEMVRGNDTRTGVTPDVSRYLSGGMETMQTGYLTANRRT